MSEARWHRSPSCCAYLFFSVTTPLLPWLSLLHIMALNKGRHFCQLGRHQKKLKMSRSGANLTKPKGLSSTLRRRGHHWHQPPYNLFLATVNVASCFVGQSQLFGKKTVVGPQQRGKGKINSKQALLAILSSVQGVMELSFVLLTATQLPQLEAPTKAGWWTWYQFVEARCISMS